MAKVVDKSIKIDKDNISQSSTRYSLSRQLILDVLKNCRDHPTADVVYSRVREVKKNVSLGTVYRNLKLISNENKVQTLETIDKKIHYDGDMSAHSHFICKKCGKIIDLNIKKHKPKELKDLGLYVEDEKCIYYGICNECK